MSQRYIGGLIYNPPGGFSGQFGAASNTYLTTASDAAFAFGTGDFTMEAFVFATASQTDNWIIGLANNCWLRIGSGGALEFYNNIASSSIIAGSAMPTNQWVHVAAVRSGTTLTLYQNGVSVASGTVSTNFSTSVACVIGNQVGFDRRWNGFISNVRVVKGTAVYTSAFTPPNGRLQAISGTSLLTCAYSTFVDGSTNNFTLTNTGGVVLSTQNPFPLTTLPNPALGNAGNGVYSMSQYQALKQQNLWPALDQRFNYVTMLLHGDGTNGAQNNTFTDSSTNNFTITRNGNTTQGTFSPYGSNWSNYFDGTGDYLSLSANSAFQLTGDFTIEYWVNPSTNTGTGGYSMHIGSATTGNASYFGVKSATSYVAQLSGGGEFLITGVPTPGVWTHVAWVRSGSTLTLYVNGASLGTTTTSATAFSSTVGIKVAAAYDSNEFYLNGYLSNLRVVKGTAVYTAAFTPPTAPLTAITNTSLLTCQSNRFIDNSSNAFTITANGNTSVQRFSPFAPTAAYSTATIGGSGYFDGTGDYLSLSATSNLAFGTGSFCIEAWIFPTSSISSKQFIIGNQNTGGGDTQFGLFIQSNNAIFGTYNTDKLTSSNPVALNAWTHVACTFDGTTYRMFINGVASGTTTGTLDLSDSTTGVQVGKAPYTSTQLITGYLSDVRCVKGSAVYTAAFTPPTAPLTAITNTQLLLNYTNAGIIDNAMMNDLETVGNAQISTSVKKYGTGSLAFDGTGDYVWTRGSNQDLNVGAGDFTVEGWFYFNSTPSTMGLFQMSNTVGGFAANQTKNLAVATNSSTTWQVYAKDTYTISSSTSVPVTTWTHFALVRSGTTTVLYIGGTAVITITSDSTTYNTPYLGLGGIYDNSSYLLNGYIDDLRITKGYARYTANFTPPTSQLQDQ